MPRKSWTVEDLKKAIITSTSIRQVLFKLGLKAAGGNYKTIRIYIGQHRLDTSHFKGHAWNKGMRFGFKPRTPLREILSKDSNYQSYKLKKRLILAGLKPKHCEDCGWSEYSQDGRLPLELDHINGDSRDNRLENLRVLCPNCHSLRPSHRGRNIKRQ